MKLTKLTVLVVINILIITSCSPKEEKYVAGTYTGIGQGHHGDIIVEVVTDEYKIKSITVIEDSEIPGLREVVYEKMPKKMIKKNTYDVDVIGGATLTSNGLRESVENALEQASIEGKE